LARGGVDHADAVLEVEDGIGAAGPHERARQQLVNQVFLQPLAGAPTGTAAFLLLDLGQLLLQQVVDHRAGQQLVLAADAEPDRIADAVRQGLGIAAEGRDEAARRQLQRTDRLERAVGEVAVEVGEVERSGEAEERQVAEEHQASQSCASGGGASPRCPSARKSKSFGSLSCEGRMSPSARAMVSMRPGDSFSQASSIFLTCLRCRFSCDPQRLQGMIGNAFASAYAAMSSSRT